MSEIVDLDDMAITRATDFETSVPDWTPCPGYPFVEGEVVEFADADAARGPTAHTISLGPEDGYIPGTTLVRYMENGGIAKTGVVIISPRDRRSYGTESAADASRYVNGLFGRCASRPEIEQGPIEASQRRFLGLGRKTVRQCAALYTLGPKGEAQPRDRVVEVWNISDYQDLDG